MTPHYSFIAEPPPECIQYNCDDCNELVVEVGHTLPDPPLCFECEYLRTLPPAQAHLIREQLNKPTLKVVRSAPKRL